MTDADLMDELTDAEREAMFPPVMRHGDMVATTRDTGLFVVENLLTDDECDRLIEQTRGHTEPVHGPGEAAEATQHPDGLRPSRWNWHCVVHAHPVKHDAAELGGLDELLWRVVAYVDHRFGWGIPFDAARFGISQYPVGDRMGPHVDDESREEPPWSLPHRGISASVVLSEPGTYEGGELRVNDGSGWRTPLSGLPRGTGVFFGSSLLHEVTEVTAGERWVLLMWAYTNHWMRKLR